MSSQNQDASLSLSADLPMKRRRGRPRKEESVQGDNSPLTPASDNLKKSKQSVETSNPASTDMVGQVVSGVIDGSFDAGYLLNVKVGDTNTHLRGLVFLPGRFNPITAANDVAPHARMYMREDIPIPFPSVNPQGQVRAVSTTSGKTVKPVEHKNDEPNVPDLGLHTGLQSSAIAATESQSASVLIPPASKLPVNDTDLHLGQKVLQEQILDSGLQNDEAVGHDQSLQGFEAFELMKGPITNIEAPKASESVSATFASTFPAAEIVNPKPQVRKEAVCSDLKPQDLIDDGAKILDLDNNQNPKISEPEPQAMDCEPTGIVNPKPQVKNEAVSSDLKPQDLINDGAKILDLGNNQNPKISEPEPQAMDCEPIGINMFEKGQGIDISLDTQSELAKKSISGDDDSNLDELTANGATTTTVAAPCTASMTNLPIMIFSAGTLPPEPKLAAEVPVLETMVVPEASSSLSAANINIVESNANDAIPPAQS